MRQRSAALLLSLPLVLAMTTSAGAAPPGDKGRPDSAGKATVSTSVSADVGAGHGNGQGNGQGNANGHAKGHANGQAKADAGASASTSSSSDKHGTATSGPLTSPQPLSNADMNGTGANPGASCTHAYCSTRDGSASENGKGEGAAVGKPCAGCVGKADNKNPPGQAPNGSDANSGYECDANQGIGKGNPAHTGCKATVAAPVPTPTKTPAVTAQVTPTPTPTQTTTTTTTVTTTTTPAPTPSPTQTTTVVTVTTPPAPVPAVTATATATATATTPPASPAATVTASPSPIGGSTGQPASSPTPVPTGAAGGGAVETPAAPSQGGGIGGGSESPATAGESSGLPFTGTAITVLAAGALVLLVLGGTLQLLARRRDHALSGQD